MLWLSACAQDSDMADNNISIIASEEEQKVEVFFNGEIFTSYLYSENLKKPILYPLKIAGGTDLTRGFPFDPRPGERTDHPHQAGLWFNYGDVNGLDFWNNSDAVPDDRKDQYGTIIHKEINDIRNGEDRGELDVSMEWVNSNGEILLTENTVFVFSNSENTRIIDRITKLTATDSNVSLKDNKEGVLGIRVARELEHPESESDTGLTGLYRSSEGLEGDDVWGTRGKWVKLSGVIHNQEVSVSILDHSENAGYPTYWHARGYGLFAANPLGQEEMSGGVDQLNYELAAGESATFKYRIIISSDSSFSDEQMNEYWDEFNDEYQGISL
ncbi:MAG: PmoA family protein [Balneolaceae bacterium]